MYPWQAMIGYDDDYDEEEEIPATTKAASLPPAAPKYGARCRGKDCGEWNEWALADTDGTFVCFQCREHHKIP